MINADLLAAIVRRLDSIHPINDDDEQNQILETLDGRGLLTRKQVRTHYALTAYG